MLRHIANLKILKAIHNQQVVIHPYLPVATHRKFKNFESNSQLKETPISEADSCDTSQI